MEAALQNIQDTCPESGQAIIKILRGTIEYDADLSLVADKLADDIVFICRAEDAKFSARSEGDDAGIQRALSYVWEVLILFSLHIPSDHEWQDRIVKAVQNLRRREGTAPGMGIGVWSDLPSLEMCMGEQWHEPDFEDTEEADPGDFAKWRNLNSFAARLTSNSYSPWMNMPIGQLRGALEEPSPGGSSQETRLWVACEWLIRCSDVIHNYLIEEEEPEDAHLATGELCDSSIPQLGPQRWEFWKRRLREVLADAEKLKLGAEISERVQGALDRMESVQSTAVKDSEPTAAS